MHMTLYIKNQFAIVFFIMLFMACKKDISQTVATDGIAPVVSLSQNTLILSSATANNSVLNINWTKADFGFKAATQYSVELVNGDNTFSSAVSVNTGIDTALSYLGSQLNELAIGLGIPAGGKGVIEIRIKSSLNESVSVYSTVSKLTLTTYTVDFPALLVRGANSWVTPSTRTKGFVLTSPNYDGKYEGYVNFPNADGWGGDGLKLQVESTGVQYGWGTSATTMAAGSAGNLWFTPAPNYMKVNADINAGTVNFIPVKFFISGDHNGWSTSATPMTFNATTQQWVATNVKFSAGNTFTFTSNGNYDISYRINTDGKLVYAGPPNWAGGGVQAPGTGTYTVILDMSAGNGGYTYKIQ
jgi:hypothetical protein